MAELDRKTLPFSYLVVVRSARPIEEILPSLRESTADRRYRLVSPAYAQGSDAEFFVCGQAGKRRARLRLPKDSEPLTRGSILTEAEIRGDVNASRIERVKKTL